MIWCNSYKFLVVQNLHENMNRYNKTCVSSKYTYIHFIQEKSDFGNKTKWFNTLMSFIFGRIACFLIKINIKKGNSDYHIVLE